VNIQSTLSAGSLGEARIDHQGPVLRRRPPVLWRKSVALHRSLASQETTARVMRILPTILLACFVAAAALLAIGFGPEEITAEATSAVPLYDATTVAGPWSTKLITVATLSAGERVHVTECRDRKSDIELLAVRSGIPVAIAGEAGSIKLHRRQVFPWSQNATRTCRGFFESISVIGAVKYPRPQRGDAKPFARADGQRHGTLAARC
jgi:hypothetical protein